MTASVPNRARRSSSVASSRAGRGGRRAAPAGRRGRRRRLRDGDADERDAPLPDQGHRRRQQVAGGGEDRGGVGRRLGQGVRARRPVKSANRRRSVTVRPTRPARRMRRVTRSTSADEHGVDLLGRVRATAPMALLRRRSSAGAARRAPGGGRGCGRGRGGGGRTPGRASPPARPRAAGRPRRRSRCPGRAAWPRSSAPTPHSRSTGSGWRNATSPLGRHDEQPVGLGDAARHLGEELGAGHADGDGQADLARARGGEAGGDLERRARHPPQPTDVEERLVDRDALDQRRRVARTRRTPPCSPRCRRTCAAGPRSRRGHSRRASRPPIAPRTPCARAS